MRHPARRLDRVAATAGAAPDVRLGVGAGAGKPLMSEQVTFQLAEMMTAVTSRGTAAAASALGRPSAGKTGTTNDNTDAWFVGFTGRVLAAVWVGFDDPTTKLGPDGDGAHAALPLWMTAVRAAEGDRPRIALPAMPPPGWSARSSIARPGSSPPPTPAGSRRGFARAPHRRRFRANPARRRRISAPPHVSSKC